MEIDGGTRVVLLGTGGGPLPSPVRAGISHALVAGGRVYVVDCGSGVAQQLRRARLLSSLHQVFVTHLHSDHVCDYFNLFLLGWPVLQWNPPVEVYGPGSAGGLQALPSDPSEQGRPPLRPGATVPSPALVCPGEPTPGLASLTTHQFAAHAYDLNIRMREAGRSDLTELIHAHEIDLPPDVGASAPVAVSPPMSPMVVAEDDAVRVSAILVQHPPVFPAFAFRFDTDDGSVVFSGDTAVSENLCRLAEGADILVHEVYTDSRADDEDTSWEAQRRQHHLVTSHTPLSAVGAVASQAGVGHLVLNHFIPGDDRLGDDYWVAGARAGYDGPVTAGRDLLELSLGHTPATVAR